MLVVAPGWALWDLAQHAGWLASLVIWATKGCAVLAGVLLLVAWFRAAGLRCVLAALAALNLVIEIRAVVAGHYFVPRPFAAYHFQPLYAHAADSSFPSLTTSYFTAIGFPAWRTWRPLGWGFAAITAEVAFGCVYVGVHYATACWRARRSPPPAACWPGWSSAVRQLRACSAGSIAS